MSINTSATSSTLNLRAFTDMLAAQEKLKAAGQNNDNKAVAIGADGRLYVVSKSSLRGIAGKSVNEQVRNALLQSLTNANVGTKYIDDVRKSLGLSNSASSTGKTKPLTVRAIRQLLGKNISADLKKIKDADLKKINDANLQKVKDDNLQEIENNKLQTILNHTKDKDGNPGPLYEAFQIKDDFGRPATMDFTMENRGNLQKSILAGSEKISAYVRGMGIHQLSRETIGSYVRQLTDDRESTLGKLFDGLTKMSKAERKGLNLNYFKDIITLSDEMKTMQKFDPMAYDITSVILDQLMKEVDRG